MRFTVESLDAISAQPRKVLAEFFKFGLSQRWTEPHQAGCRVPATMWVPQSFAHFAE
jgi:hypothetical protein